MKKLQQIKEIIIKSNPEIVEVKFGCEVTMGTKQIFFVVGMMPSGDPITVKKEGAYDSTKQGADVEKINGKIKVIGRPIRLADVLWAIHTEAASNFHYNFYKMDREIISHWNLKDDNLDNQIEQTIDAALKYLNESKN